MSKVRRQHRRSLAAACITCTAVVLLLYAVSPRYRSYEWAARDKLAKYGRKAPSHPELLFLAIDNASSTLDLAMDDDVARSPALQLMQGGFPFPRSLYPLIIERLVGAGAKVVVFDMLFPVAKDTDPPFREALDRYHDQVVIGMNLEQRDQGARGDRARERHTKVPPATSLIPPGPDDRVGFVNFWPDDEDQIVRRAVYITTNRELDDRRLAQEGLEVFHSLAARTLAKAGHAAAIPQSRDSHLFRFCSDLRPYSLWEIFVDAFWQKPPYNGGELFRDKIVIVGPDGNWVKDELNTPFGRTNGPRIHISAINAGLTGEFLKETTPIVNVFLICASGTVAWLLGRFLRAPLRRFLILVALAGALYGAAQYAFNVAGYFPIVLSPLLALVASGISFSVVEQSLDLLEKARLRRTLDRYVSKDVVRELVDNPQSWLNTLGGQRKPITILFSDVRGFTTLTESSDPATLVKQLNEYFDDMVEIVFGNKGTLDKFVGDCVMAHWGSITTDGTRTDAQRAVATAMKMRNALAKLNPEWKERGMLEFKVGIGINHGEAIVGNLGSKEKAEVSAISDAVNLASRLEGVTKEYGIDLCIGEGVAPLVRDAFILRSLDLIIVKGKTKPVEIFTVLKEREAGVAEPPWLATHEEAVRRYRAGDFVEADRLWREVLAQCPGDSIAEVFLERCAALQKAPPDGKWDGVFEMKTK